MNLLISTAAGLIASLIASLGATLQASDEIRLLNVSYDPTRELYQDINPAFIAHWKAQTGKTLVINQSHGGSGKQARSVIDGLDADVVTLALAPDIDAIAHKSGLLPDDWQSHLPQNSSPYTSTIVFLVRKGNPKHITDWSDLIRPGIEVIPANPKTSGGARWTYLAAYGYALKANHGDEAKARVYISAFYAHAPVLDTGARGATTTFIERGIGDVLVGWENEALLAKGDTGGDAVEVVYPSISILAEPPVAVVEQVAKKHGTLVQAQAYLRFLYTDEAQRIIAKHHYRPRSAAISAEVAGSLPAIPLFTIDEAFGGWAKVQATHFAEGGIFDQISAK